MFKIITNRCREYIFIILTATIFSFTLLFTESFSEENVFIIENVKIEGDLNANFSREQYVNRAFLNSFEILMSKILLSKDLNKVTNIKLKKIKNLINSFQINEETYRNNLYKGNFKIYYNDNKVKKLLVEKNISFSQPKNISAVFFPVLFVNDNLQNFDENYFYNKWTEIKIKNELINFILPIEDLEDISKIKEIKNKIKEFNISELTKKYNTKNYVFTLMIYQNKKLNIYLKTNFNNNEVSKNIFYEVININDELKLNLILKELKIIITDIWKSENIINLTTPLSIRIKFKYQKLEDLDKLRNIFYKINTIDNYSLEEFNINNSVFKIYYYGNPKKLRTELLDLGYQLVNDSGHWEISIDD